MSFLLIILLFVIAWVVLILPRQRELKRHNALVAVLEVGDEVMTGSGIYGTIVAVEPDTVILQVAPGTELKVARRAVAAKVGADTEPTIVEADGEDADTDGESAS